MPQGIRPEGYLFSSGASGSPAPVYEFHRFSNELASTAIRTIQEQVVRTVLDGHGVDLRRPDEVSRQRGKINGT